MQQQVSVITLGIAELARSRRFYTEGFGWQPVFDNEDIIFYQMNGFVLGTFLIASLEEDMNRDRLSTRSAFALAHNVATRNEVYVADPDGHAWEVAWNPAWRISPEGFVTFGV